MFDNQPANNTNNSRGFKKSDAFLNLEIVTSQPHKDPARAAAGEMHTIRIQKGLGLDGDSKLGRTLINAHNKAEAAGEELVFNIRGTVNLREDDSSEYDL